MSQLKKLVKIVHGALQGSDYYLEPTNDGKITLSTMQLFLNQKFRITDSLHTLLLLTEIGKFPRDLRLTQSKGILTWKLLLLQLIILEDEVRGGDDVSGCSIYFDMKYYFWLQKQGVYITDIEGKLFYVRFFNISILNLYIETEVINKSRKININIILIFNI